MKEDTLFISLYQKYKTPVFYYAYSILKDRGLAEDIMQETFIRVRAHAHQYRTYDNIRVWILRITHNLSLNCIRDRASEICAEDFETLLPGKSTENNMEESDYINNILMKLPPEERLMFSLHYIHKYRYKEIAQSTHTPMGTVQTRCRTARKKLQQILAEETKI